MNWWKSIGPLVVCAWKLGATLPRRSAPGRSTDPIADRLSSVGLGG